MSLQQRVVVVFVLLVVFFMLFVMMTLVFVLLELNEGVIVLMMPFMVTVMLLLVRAEGAFDGNEQVVELLILVVDLTLSLRFLVRFRLVVDRLLL